MDNLSKSNQSLDESQAATGIGTTVRETFDSLSNEGKMKFSLDALAATLQIWNKQNEELLVLTDQHKEWISVLRWGKDNDMDWTIAEAQAVESDISAYCRSNKHKIEKVKSLDPAGRYEWVNAYHINDWDAYWEAARREQDLF